MNLQHNPAGFAAGRNGDSTDASSRSFDLVENHPASAVVAAFGAGLLAGVAIGVVLWSESRAPDDGAAMRALRSLASRLPAGMTPSAFS